MNQESAPKYVVGKPVEYVSRGFEAAAPPVVLEMQARRAAPPEEPGRPKEKRAVWIVHGMGQQVPFETLDNLAQGLLLVAKDKLLPGSEPRVTAVKFKSASGGPSQVVERVELDVRDPEDPGKACQLHLYEAYWAPLTEGVAKTGDVIGFLLNGGFRGLLNSLRPFHRAMFPPVVPAGMESGWQLFRIPKRAALEVLFTIGILASLLAINTVVVAAGAAAAKLPGIWQLAASLPWENLAALASAIFAVALTFGVILFLGEMSKPPGLKRAQRILISTLGWLGFGLTAGTIMAGALLMLLGLKSADLLRFQPPVRASLQTIATLFLIGAAGLSLLALVVRGAKRSAGTELRGDGLLVFFFVLAFVLHLAVIPALIYFARHPLPSAEQLPACVPPAGRMMANLIASPLWVFPALIALTKLVRELLIQFPGDVAIYVDSNKLDRFDKVRKEIKQLALDSASSIYTALDENGEFVYSKIAIVGHSLGSVIAYDTLNKLLNLDDLARSPGANQGPVGVAGRTCLLETFGSPLDKIAFFFTIQGQESFHIREQLAAVVQPLIQSYAKFRPQEFRWINVRSGNDIISGPLTFYDLPGKPVPPAVEDVTDPDAVVPIVAHTDYWKNKTVWMKLYERVKP
ncbi:MAG TPA: hypothetical protein VMT51_00090 [Dongiaceae bacterium]|nr:hypothetical protein [Dongiaceae bacterium]